MPKQTFFNLPEEKRQAILDIAIDEFAEHDFKNASVTRIVSRAGIAKGSIYQYFENKEDLHLYLLDLAGQEKVRFLESHQPPDPQMGLFAYIQWALEIGVRMNFTNPRLERVVYRALYTDQSNQTEAILRIRETGRAYWRQLVEQAIARGELAEGHDPDLITFVFTTLTSEFGIYIMHRLQQEHGEFPPEELRARYTDQSLPLFRDLMSILEQGLRRK
ncbi:MAG TPA: TetR/AcrR family transcriptional regulator [Symbiobacteriaceae bacterium]|nr:TetR/AcrR family transcriptional regulator [Symbiobacteriaceae bacterium]